MASRLQALRTASAAQAQTYRPEILRLSRSEERERWQALLETPGISVFDALESQLRELVGALNPSKGYRPDELRSLANEHIGSTPMEEYGVWVHYPWSNRLVHLLDEAEFALVRTDRNRNKITREEQAVLGSKRVGIIGLSVGQSAALTLALERSFGELRIADHDTLDLSNLNRVRSGLHHLGLGKCVNVAREIAEIDPFLKVTCYPDGLHAGNIDRFFTEGGNLDLLIEECDSVEIKILSRLKARQLRIPVVMDTSDRGLVDVERFDLEPERPILHGLIEHLDIDQGSKAKTNEEKMPFLTAMVGLDGLSARMKASLLELNQTLGTWPQLATNVVLGGAIAADAARRVMLGHSQESGRWYVDLERLTASSGRPGGSLYAGLSEEQHEALTLDEMLRIATLLPAADNGIQFTNEQARVIAEAGAKAPSAGNAQPWKFLLYEGRLLLFHDHARSASKLDPQGMIADIALGACLENMILRAGELGLVVSAEWADNDAGPLVAVLNATGKSQGTDASSRLARQIGLRHTNRKKGEGKPIDAPTIELLEKVVDDGSTRLHVITDREALAELASIAGAAERIRVLSPSGHNEFFRHEVRWTREEAERTRDGLDVDTLELSAVGRTALPAASDPEAIELLRHWGGGKGLERISSEAILSSAAIALVSTADLTRRVRSSGGQAVQRFWLSASAEGLAVHPVSAAIFLGTTAGLPNAGVFSETERAELLSHFARLKEIFTLAGREPLFMMRLSHSGAASARALRLPIEQLFFIAQPLPTDHGYHRHHRVQGT